MHRRTWEREGQRRYRPSVSRVRVVLRRLSANGRIGNLTGLVDMVDMVGDVVEHTGHVENRVEFGRAGLNVASE